MRKLIKGCSNCRAVAEDFINNPLKKILWIYGRTGCGKTKLADFLIQKLESKNKRVCPLSANRFLRIVIELIRSDEPFISLISYCQNYDLLVLDNMDIEFGGKPKTQEEIKRIIFEIIKDKKTKIVLIGEKRPKKLRNLKFDTEHCHYIHLKVPEYDFKINLLKNWAKKKNVLIQADVIISIAKASKNLFQLKGLFNRFYLKQLNL